MMGEILFCSLNIPYKVFHHQIPGSYGVLKSIKILIKVKYHIEQHKA
jgi:hypothetical protein